MGGQACVFYGAAQVSKDVDLVVLAQEENFSRLLAALAQLKAKSIAVPRFDPVLLARGHAVHFRCAASGVPAWLTGSTAKAGAARETTAPPRFDWFERRFICFVFAALSRMISATTPFRYGEYPYQAALGKRRRPGVARTSRAQGLLRLRR
jgi:hypothetical protein